MPTPALAALAAVFGAIVGWLSSVLADRAAGRRTAARRAAVAMLGACLAAAVVLARSGTDERALGVALIAVLLPVSLIDLDTRRIPNRITGPAAALALAIGLALDPSRVPAQLLAGVAAAGFLLLFALLYPRGLGMGDVKLAGVLGLFLGGAVAVALVAGLIASALLGVVVMARLGVARGRKTGIPLGPFLALGGVVAILAGSPIVHWYVHSMAH
jgi:leader peptidase (prepilin peptidase)/N-methyltransferase